MSDTSVISNLALIGRLYLLQRQFQTVWIPDAVWAELSLIPSSGANFTAAAFREGWLQCRTVQNRRFAAVLARDLDAGESEAIALAAEMPADILLMDEKDGRLFARQAGLSVRGILGVLLRAKRYGCIQSVRVEIDALHSRAGFFISTALERQVLQDAGE